MTKQPAEKKINGCYVALPRAEHGVGMCGSKQACSASEVTALLPVLLRKLNPQKTASCFVNAYGQYPESLREEAAADCHRQLHMN